jgi:hypothetical protein
MSLGGEPGTCETTRDHSVTCIIHWHDASYRIPRVDNDDIEVTYTESNTLYQLVLEHAIFMKLTHEGCLFGLT